MSQVTDNAKKTRNRRTEAERCKDALIFIDTNILLDFYRMSTKGESINWLKKIDDNHKRIITTCQVEMEFKKHRQKVMLESITKLKFPDDNTLQIPIFMAEEAASKKIQEKRKEILKNIEKIRNKMKNWLHAPEKSDEIYKSLQRLFRSKSNFRLNRDSPERRNLKHKARTRFGLGYPPRKDNDFSIGDALNWEWIIHCAASSDKDIILLSRDSDYFVRIDKSIVINTWLGHEFRDRVSKQRKIYVFDRLSAAFKKAGISVSKAEENSEKDLIEHTDEFTR